MTSAGDRVAIASIRSINRLTVLIPLMTIAVGTVARHHDPNMSLWLLTSPSAQSSPTRRVAKLSTSVSGTTNCSIPAATRPAIRDGEIAPSSIVGCTIVMPCRSLAVAAVCVHRRSRPPKRISSIVGDAIEWDRQ